MTRFVELTDAQVARIMADPSVRRMIGRPKGYVWRDDLQKVPDGELSADQRVARLRAENAELRGKLAAAGIPALPPSR